MMFAVESRAKQDFNELVVLFNARHPFGRQPKVSDETLRPTALNGYL